MSLIDVKEFLTVKECAEVLDCHADTVSAMVRRGELKAIRLGRAIRIVAKSIHALSTKDSKKIARAQP